MANGHGGKRAGAGRRVGSGDKPHIRDYWTPEQIANFYRSLYERALKSDRLAVFVGEQLSGKAAQPLTGDKDNPVWLAGVEITVRKK